MKKRNTTMAVTAALLLLGGVAVAQPGMNMGRGEMPGRGGANQGGGMMLERLMPMLHHLELTDEQMQEVREILDDARDQMESIRSAEENTGMREQFMDLFSSSTLTVTEVEGMLNRRLDSMEAMNSVVAGALVDIHDILTPEQLQAMANFEPGEHMSGMHEGNPPMMRDGHGMNHPR